MKKVKKAKFPIRITREHSWQVQQRVAEIEGKEDQAIPSLTLEMSKEICRGCGLVRYRNYETGKIVKVEEPEGYKNTCEKKSYIINQ